VFDLFVSYLVLALVRSGNASGRVKEVMQQDLAELVARDPATLGRRTAPGARTTAAFAPRDVSTHGAHRNRLVAAYVGG
jgi:hypothetical protein